MHPTIRLLAATLLMIGAAACQHNRTSKLTPPAGPPPLPTPDAKGLAAVNGIKIYYEVFNANGGDPVLLFHGGCASTRSWGYQLPLLMKTHRVIAIDSRGHGRSTRDEQPFSYHLMATDALAILDFLKVDKVAVVGVSDGAEVGLDLAIHHPERLSRLYLQGASFSLAGKNPIDPNSPWARQVIAWVRQEYLQLSPTPERFDDFFAAINRMWAAEPNFAPADLRRISVPIRFAHAEHDQFVQRAHAEELARLIPGATLEVLPGVDHFVGAQNPEVFNRSMMGFLDGK